MISSGCFGVRANQTHWNPPPPNKKHKNAHLATTHGTQPQHVAEFFVGFSMFFWFQIVVTKQRHGPIDRLSGTIWLSEISPQKKNMKHHSN